MLKRLYWITKEMATGRIYYGETENEPAHSEPAGRRTIWDLHSDITHYQFDSWLRKRFPALETKAPCGCVWWAGSQKIYCWEHAFPGEQMADAEAWADDIGKRLGLDS
jgi:hypothetical protein